MKIYRSSELKRIIVNVNEIEYMFVRDYTIYLKSKNSNFTEQITYESIEDAKKDFESLISELSIIQ